MKWLRKIEQSTEILQLKRIGIIVAGDVIKRSPSHYFGDWKESQPEIGDFGVVPVSCGAAKQLLFRRVRHAKVMLRS